MEHRKYVAVPTEVTGMTYHARIRCQQRAIPPLVVDWLLAYGEERHDNRGAVTRYFDKRSKRAIEQQVGSHVFRSFSEYMKCYLVESVEDGGVITAGYLNRRVKEY